MRRRDFLCWAVFSACLIVSIAACTGRPKAPHAGIRSLWRQYQELPAERALSVAGDPDYIWVGASAGGASTREEAEQRALVECKRRRLARRIQPPCLIFASGDEVLWEKR